MSACLPGCWTGRCGSAVTAAPAIGEPSAPAARAKPGQASFVLARAVSAEIDSRRLILVTTDRAGTSWTDESTQQQRYRSGLLAPDGQPLIQNSMSIRDGMVTSVQADYKDHAYTIDRFSAGGSPKDQFNIRVSLSDFLPLQGNPNPLVAFQQALQSGVITVVGHRKLNGQDTILLHIKVRCYLNTPSFLTQGCLALFEPPGTPPKPLPPKFRQMVENAKKHMTPHQLAWAQAEADLGVPISPDAEVWVDAKTYLIAKFTVYHVEGIPASVYAGPPPQSWLSILRWRPMPTSVRWLQPTPERLAWLTLTPPAGFTQVTDAQMTTYLGPYS